MAKSTQKREWWFRCLCSCSWQVENMFEYSHVFLMSSPGMLCSSWGKHCLPGMCSPNCVLATCSFSSPHPLSSALRAFDFLGIWWAYLWLCCDKQTSPKLEPLGSTEFYFFPFSVHVGVGLLGVSWGNTYVLIRPHRISSFSDWCDKTDRMVNQKNTRREDIFDSWCEDTAVMVGRHGGRNVR